MDDAVIATHLENFSRGFARVEQILQTLATKEGVNKLDRRLERVEQILPTLATKEEVNKLDRRLERVEQILPTLATKEEFRAAIAAAVEPLATRDELRVAVEPLATKDEIRELRRYMDVLSESQRGDIQLLAEHLTVVMSKLNDR